MFHREFANCLRSFSTLFLRHSVSIILQLVEKASMVPFPVSFFLFFPLENYITIIFRTGQHFGMFAIGGLS